ncbi:LysR family transcriptional regulator [Brucella pseudogrignonensis]|jgi:DNA-binding transcriptional LysR family regulator|uniref:LysR family transcriptional regulator n=1 Tax=Brucella pseudogrignonensis TaxID=419475 RepID=UPI00190D3402|nr:LysR family transcriptional regulator [Brucella pseudogrignonensis]MBK0022574.1 LysR family transcriptional regulator [Ochrobactrum sp. S45]MBK0044589.1 LysR family transcriptional regulator [Ochrobactrum sp. S46]UKK95522.1 LysR family transcriptional regulator [Brucella pseudogrignonensis]
MIDHFGDVLAFVRVADTASFTKAAERLGVTRSAVGKSLTRLEEALSTRLVHRTTRSVRLTEEGQLFYEHALRILCEVDDAQAMLSQRNQQPKGRLRVDLPTAFGRLHVLPVLQDYLAEWPELEADVSFSDDYCDLVGDGIDVAVRIGGPTDSGLIRQVLAPHRLLTCAAPAYLEKRGIPQVLDDLRHHNRIAFSYANLPVSWRYQIAGEERALAVEGRLRLSNTEAIRDAALNGLGLVQLGAFLVGADIAQGRLVAVLENYARDEPPIVAVYPTRRHVSPKVRRFVEALRSAWAAGPPW